ncbi:hypothetical protein SUDANB6_01834 [Streptomyces sp. enrichment culture]|uniref:hypothetical protein n=1 Tax=Streptomyces sp. enrichment culture TaxID=1795815 RepID=UPI003F55692B
MPADGIRDDSSAEVPPREGTGPRHAVPRKPLLNRFHMPAGKAIALAAMPTAVLMGMGFTPRPALADIPLSSASNSLTAEEYEACVAALEKSGTAKPSPSASPGEEEKDGEDGKGAPAVPSASAGAEGGASAENSAPGRAPSSDSGSDDAAPEGGRTGPAEQGARAAEPSPSPSPSARATGADVAASAPPPPEPKGGGLLEGIGDTVEGVLAGGGLPEGAGPVPTPVPTPSASASGSAVPSPSAPAEEPAKEAAKEAAERTAGTSGAAAERVERDGKDGKDGIGKAAEEAGETAGEAAGGEAAGGEATASPGPGSTPSASASADPADCPIATDAEGGVDNALLVPDDPWYLEASSLLLKGADYQGVVEVETASGTTKRVLKYVVSDGTDIGDLHQIVKDRSSGRTYHVQAAEGSTSTIRDGKTIMYTESISGKLLGLIPITFDPEHPPPLNIPLVYFTDVRVTQAGQFGGTLTIPGLRQTITD